MTGQYGVFYKLIEVRAPVGITYGVADCNST